MADKNSPIGVLDSGVGGLSVLRRLRALLPKEDFIYLGDTARTPYGGRSEAEVRQFVEEMLCFFDTQDVKLVVIACNTLTVLGVDTLQKEHKFPIIGMSKGEALVTKATRCKKVGVFATAFTIGTEAHKKAITAYDPTVTVVPVPCPKFVPLIEGERFHTPEVEEAVREYTDILKGAGADTVILSCTHYPFLREEIQQAMGDATVIIDPADATGGLAEECLAAGRMLKSEGNGRLKICCTADVPRVRRLADYIMPGAGADFAEIRL